MHVGAGSHGMMPRVLFQTARPTASARCSASLRAGAVPPRPRRNSLFLPHTCYAVQRHGGRQFSGYQPTEDDGEAGAALPFREAAGDGPDSRWPADSSGGGGGIDDEGDGEAALEQFTTIKWSKEHANSVHLIGTMRCSTRVSSPLSLVSSLLASCLHCTAHFKAP